MEFGDLGVARQVQSLDDGPGQGGGPDARRGVVVASERTTDLAQQFGGGPAWVDAGHPDPVRSLLLAQGARQLAQPRLARGKGRPLRYRVQAGGGVDQHHVPAAGAQGGQQQAGEFGGRDQVDRQHLPPQLHRGVRDRGDRGDPGAVHESVQFRQFREIGQHLGEGLGVTQVGAQQAHQRMLLRELGEAVGVTAQSHHRPPLPNQSLHQRRADPARRPAHQDGAPARGCLPHLVRPHDGHPGTWLSPGPRV
ncbi:hypothetical protein GCM10009603_46160 [Nocardiopsis exhalans]